MVVPTATNSDDFSDPPTGPRALLRPSLLVGIPPNSSILHTISVTAKPPSELHLGNPKSWPVNRSMTRAANAATISSLAETKAAKNGTSFFESKTSLVQRRRTRGHLKPGPRRLRELCHELIRQLVRQRVRLGQTATRASRLGASEVPCPDLMITDVARRLHREPLVGREGG
jgi:hypothetical protein